MPHLVKIELSLDRQPFEIMVLAPVGYHPPIVGPVILKGQVFGRVTNKNRPHSGICALLSGALKCEVDDLFIQGQEASTEW